MCLAIPMHIDAVHANGTAEVSADGLIMTAALDLVPQAQVGDYVLMHAGFAIQIMHEGEANDTLAVLREMG